MSASRQRPGPAGPVIGYAHPTVAGQYHSPHANVTESASPAREYRRRQPDLGDPWAL